MQNFNLTTWAGDRMVAYEPLTAYTIGEVVAFVHGMITERTRAEGNLLAKLGVRYVIDHGHRALEELTVGTESNVGTWHTVEHAGGTKLLWQPNEADLKRG